MYIFPENYRAIFKRRKVLKVIQHGTLSVIPGDDDNFYFLIDTFTTINGFLNLTLPRKFIYKIIEPS